MAKKSRAMVSGSINMYMNSSSSTLLKVLTILVLDFCYHFQSHATATATATITTADSGNNHVTTHNTTITLDSKDDIYINNALAEQQKMQRRKGREIEIDSKSYHAKKRSNKSKTTILKNVNGNNQHNRNRYLRKRGMQTTNDDSTSPSASTDATSSFTSTTTKRKVIVNGTFANTGSYPWFTSILFDPRQKDQVICGGILVAPDFVLTSAQCTSKPNIYVRIGDLALNEDVNTITGANNIANTTTTTTATTTPHTSHNHNGHGVNTHNQPHTSRITTTEQDNRVEYRNIQEIHVHPNYGNGTGDLSNFTNDFALLQLSEVSTITPVSVVTTSSATSHQYNGGEELWTIGFGRDQNGSFPNSLKQTALKYIPKSKCIQQIYDYYSPPDMVDLPSESVLDNMICAGGESSEFVKGGCFGDSGGPLYDAMNNVVIGVTSFGFGNCDFPLPSVFSSISDQIGWIRDTICTNSNNTSSSWCSNSCPMGEFIGRTLFIPNNNTCNKLEIFEGGVFAQNSSDPNCTSMTMEHSVDSIVGDFDFMEGSQIYYKQYGEQQGWDARVDLEEDETIKEVIIVENKLANNSSQSRSQERSFGLIFPSCRMGPSYPLMVEDILNRTFHVNDFSSCIQIELFENGLMTQDLSDLYCNSTVSNYTTTLSTLDYWRGNKAYFKKYGDLGWKGQIEFYEDSTLTEMKSEQKIEEGQRLFRSIVTFPS